MKSKILIQIVVLVTLFLIPITASSTDWTLMTIPSGSFWFNDIWGSSASNVFAVGMWGNILHYNGTSWHSDTSGYGATFYGVWCSSSGSDAFAVGLSGTIVHYISGTWSTMSSGTTNTLYGVWGSSATDVFAVGAGGTILHYISGTWSTMSSGTTNTLYGVWGNTATDVFAVGAGGTILHYNGSTWTSMNSGTTNDLRHLWGSSGSNVFAVGTGGTIIHYNGSAWSSMYTETTVSLFDVWGSSGTDVFVLGISGDVILHTTDGGQTWSFMASPTLNYLFGVWGSSATDVFAVGSSSTILHYNGTGITYSISGRVTGDIQAGVTMTLSGSGSGTKTTDAAGNYSFIGLSNGTYTVTPSKSGYTFTPSSISNITISGASKTKQDFTAATYSISGRVTGDIQAGVTMTLSGAASKTTTTDGSGNYSFTLLSNGTYTVTPNKSGYTFTPLYWQVTISGASKIDKDFFASAIHSISGTVTFSSLGFSGVTMSLSNSTTGTAQTDSSGNYSFTGLINGTYTVTPSLSSYTFTPTSIPVTISGEDVTGVDFIATETAGLWGWSSMDTPWTTAPLNSVWGSSATDVFAVGPGDTSGTGTIVHYNGSAWSPMYCNTTQPLNSVWGSSPTDVFAVGGNGTIVHYNGTSWSSMSSGTSDILHSVWGSACNDVFAIGHSNEIIFHFNGSTWSKMYRVPGSSIRLSSVWGSSGTDVFAVGSGGTILHYNGTSWSYMSSGTTEGLNTIWGSSAADVFAVGGNGTILHYDGSEWTSMQNPLSGTPNNLSGVWGNSGSDVFAVSGSTILHYNGSAWSTMSSGTTNTLYGVWGSSGSDVFAVGGPPGSGYGIILHYNGTDWTTLMQRGITGELNGVWASSETDVFVVGDSGTILHYNSGTWSQMTSGTTKDLSGVWASSETDVFAVGASGTLHYNGTTWSPMATGEFGANAIWGSSPTDVFAVSGGILHYNGSAWSPSPMESGTSSDALYGVWGSSGSDVFAVGLYDLKWVIFHYNGTTWSKMPNLPVTEYSNLYGVWGSSGSDVFAVGWYYNSDESDASIVTILHYNGTSWSLQYSGTTNYDLYGVWGSSGSDVFAVGSVSNYGTPPSYSIILHYNGTSWTPMIGGGGSSVGGSSATDVFAVGGSGILHYPTHSISGSVTGAVQGGVTITLSGSGLARSKTTNASGNYTFTDLKNGTYILTPSLSGYIFELSSREVQINDNCVIGIGFVASPEPTYTISGTVSGDIQAGVTIMMVYDSCLGDTTTTTTNASGEYNSFTGLINGRKYTVTPSKTGYIFEPSNKEVTISGADVTVNFKAVAIYSISGTVFGDVQAGVTIMIQYDSISADTTTNTSGYYEFRGLRKGTYTITPRKTDYIFDPPFLQVQIIGANVTRDFLATFAPYSISGKVTCSGCDKGVVFTMFLSGDVTNVTTTDSSTGNYSFTGLRNGTYTVTPYKIGYTFNPEYKKVTINNANVTQNFTATPPAFSISGTVSGDTQAGVTMTLSGTSSGITTTVASGNYSFTKLSNGTYTVTPSKTNYTFTPPSTSVTISNANWMGVNFTAKIVPTYTISGTVTGDTQAGVTMTLSGSMSGTTITGTSGNYTFRGLINGPYTVTPSKSGYTFTPTSRTVTINSANVIGADFTASTTYSISGTVTGDTQADVTITILYDSVLGDTTTNTSGNYTFRNLSNGTYTVTPSKTNYTFKPPYQKVTIDNADVLNVNFISAPTYTISGTVTLSTAGLSGVTMNLFGSVSANTTTNTSGYYEFRGLSNGPYTVKPSKAGYTFSPSSTQVIISGADVTGVNFVAFVVEGCSTWADVITKYYAYLSDEATWADVIDCYLEYLEYSSTYSISGTVTGDIQAGVTMTLSGDISAITTTTDSSGNYTFSGLSNGSYIVEPSLSNYTFSPASTQVTVSEADVTGVNFVATALGGCSTWADVNAKYEDYVSGEITWAEFFSCYQEYTTQ